MQFTLFEVFPQLISLMTSLTLAYSMFDTKYYIVIGLGSFLNLIINFSAEEHYYYSNGTTNDLDDESQSILTDSLINFESVKLFSNEQYEGLRYREGLRRTQASKNGTWGTINKLDSLGSFISAMAKLTLSVICGYDVVKGRKSISDLLMLETFISQIKSPVN